jgi:hypothetical protein
MHARTLGTTVAVLVAVTALTTACSKSSPKATPEYGKGLVVFYTPGTATAPTLPASFSNCVYGKASASDRATLGKVTSQDDVGNLADAVGVRTIRNSHNCDANLTEQLVQAEIFAGAPASISASQKSCTTTKVIDSINAIDDTKLTGTNTKAVQSAAQNAAKACGIQASG